jgi:hypothetical protein
MITTMTRKLRPLEQKLSYSYAIQGIKRHQRRIKKKLFSILRIYKLSISHNNFKEHTPQKISPKNKKHGVKRMKKQAKKSLFKMYMPILSL